MIEKLKELGWKKTGGFLVMAFVAFAFIFGGFGGGFSTNNQNNIAKINKTNVTTQDFIDYVNQSGISQEAIRDNLDNNIIEELLSGLISTTLIDLEIEDFDLSINERTILKNIKENKNFQDENGAFQRIKYEKFLLSNNLSAPMFELQLKNRELQKHLFDFIGAGTITLPDGGAGYVLWSIPESWYAAGYENIGLLVLSPGAFIILGLVIWAQREMAGIEEEA